MRQAEHGVRLPHLEGQQAVEGPEAEALRMPHQAAAKEIGAVRQRVLWVVLLGVLLGRGT